MSELAKVIVNEEKIIDMFDMCGIKELEIIISLLKKRINIMLQKAVDVVKMFENDNVLRKSKKTIENQYKIIERIENLLK